MSLALIQDYSSAEEEEQDQHKQNPNYISDHFSDDDTHHHDAVLLYPNSYNPIAVPISSSESDLPSALDAFSEVFHLIYLFFKCLRFFFVNFLIGDFLFVFCGYNNCVDDRSSGNDNGGPHRRRRTSRDKKDLPQGAVREAKAQLVGIHERVRSDIEGSTSNQPQKTSDNGSQPSLCLQCGIPKTYTSAHGMKCPVCPSSDDSKKKGLIKRR